MNIKADKEIYKEANNNFDKKVYLKQLSQNNQA